MQRKRGSGRRNLLFRFPRLQRNGSRRARHARRAAPATQRPPQGLSKKPNTFVIMLLLLLLLYVCRVCVRCRYGAYCPQAKAQQQQPVCTSSGGKTDSSVTAVTAHPSAGAQQKAESKNEAAK